MHRGAKIREAHRVAPADLPLKCGVVLMDARLLQVEWHYVHRRSTANTSCNAAARNRADTVNAVSRPSLKWVASHTALGNFLVERICGDRIADSLCRRSWIVDPITAANHRLVADSVSNADTRREIQLVDKNRASTQSVGVRECISKIDNARVEKFKRLLGWDHETAQLACRGIHVVRIKVGDQ